MIHLIPHFQNNQRKLLKRKTSQNFIRKSKPNLKFLKYWIVGLKAFKSCLNVEQEMECETDWKVANKFANYSRHSQRSRTTALFQNFVFKYFPKTNKMYSVKVRTIRCKNIKIPIKHLGSADKNKKNLIS